MISFPFWLLTPAAPADAIESPLAFSSVERMADFLSTRGGGQWSVELVNRYSVEEVLAELHQKGMTQVRYEVDANGSVGSQLSFDEILAASKRGQ